MKKILVVLTGGTIGSRVDGSIIDVQGDSPYMLISMYEKYYGREKFEVIHPLNVLSENMTPDSLLLLLQTLDKVKYDDFDGIIITHGSDTLSFTSAYVGLLFHHVPVPVVLVASNYPLGQERSNGLNNFAQAVQFIRQRAVRGVFTLYQDGKGINQVYLATRIVEADPFRDQFRDFGGRAFGRMEDGKFILAGSEPGGCLQHGRIDAKAPVSGDLTLANRMQPSVQAVEANRERNMELPASFTRNIMVIRPYPGMDYSCLRFDEKNKPGAVLHYLYHSATACTVGEKYDFLSFIERCRKLSVDVYIASCKRTEGSRYATGDALLKAGAIPLLNISLEAAYAKLMLLYNGKENVSGQLVQKNYYFESIGAQNG